MLKKLSVLAAGFAVAVSSPAMALTFVGFTSGCFGADCTPETTFAAGATDEFRGVVYTNSQFSVTEAGGVAGIGAQANPPLNTDNLGSFSAPTRNRETNYNQVFKLGVTFTDPATTQGVFSGLLTGTITGTAGGVALTFADSSQTFTFDGGSFDLMVDNLSLTPGAPAVALTGRITNIAVSNEVPEPETWGLLLLGFAGIGFSMRRRKAEGQSQRVRVAYS